MLYIAKKIPIIRKQKKQQTNIPVPNGSLRVLFFRRYFWLLKEGNPIQIFEAERAGVFQIVNFERKQLLEIEKIVIKYSDRQIDLADASLIFLAEQLGHGNILSTDITDFTVYRWNRTNSFNILM